MRRLGILAGKGGLPLQIAAAAEAQGRRPFVIAFEGQVDADLFQAYPHAQARLGAARRTIKLLKNEGCEDIIFAGSVKRPTLAELRPDWRAARIFAKAGLAWLGDDGLLKVIRKELESEGFKVIAAQDILHTLLMPPGLLTDDIAVLNDDTNKDIQRGCAVLRALAPVDVGQAVIVQQGIILAVEAIEGTAEMIRRSSTLKRAGHGGILIKMSKPQQDARLDLPTIGPETIEQAHQAGLVGIAVEAGRTILLEQEVTLELCKKYGLFLIGIDHDAAIT